MMTQTEPIPALLPSVTTTQEIWRSARRPELLELFRRHVYGRNAVDRPASLAFNVTHTDPAAMNGAATRKQITVNYVGPYNSGSLPFTLFTPNHAPHPVPAFLYINIGDRNRIDPTRQLKHVIWPAEELIARGYAAAAYQVDDLAPNFMHTSHTPQPLHPVSPVINAFEKPGEARAADAWGTIGIWAWGASRIMDCLETEPAINSRQVAVIGHSRAGKTALWAGAQDERFAMTISTQSGCTGAALARNKSSDAAEKIARINGSFPHWFCANYKQYNHRDTEVPLDQHMLLALIAPRLLYVSSATDDALADPACEYAALQLAQPAWRLHNLPTLPPSPFPAAETVLHETPTGYHLRPGAHALNAQDWPHYLDFADKHLKAI